MSQKGGVTIKVAILTMFNGLSNTYSLVNVVREHIAMLLNNNIKVKILVSEHCPDSDRTGIFADSRIEWVKIINSHHGEQFHWKTYIHADDEISDTFFDEAKLVEQDFIKHLQDVDLCMMHDILYQGVHLLHNVAIREAQKSLPNVKFICLIHSAPVKYLEAPYPINCMYSPMPNTLLAYPTASGLEAVARQYNTNTSNCICISNCMDTLLGMNDETIQICNHINLFETDILIVYPARLTTGKKFHILSEFAGFIKTYCHKTVNIVFCDFPSTDIQPELYKAIVKDYGIKSGLSSEDILFTSDCGFENGVDRKTVFELFTLSNLFICPSYSESFGLTVIEAASRGNYIVLNESVPALKELGTNLNSYFMRWDAKNFDFNTIEHYQPTKELYYIENAKQIVTNMTNNSVIHSKTLARIQYSPCNVFRHQILPILENMKN